MYNQIFDLIYLPNGRPNSIFGQFFLTIYHVTNYIAPL